MFSHIFHKLMDRYFAWEMRLNQDDPGGLIDKLRSVMPETLPDGECLIYQWVPPRRDANGQPLEVTRLRIFRVPIGKDGPLLNGITRVLNENDVPKSVQMPSALQIPPEIKQMKRHDDLDHLAATIGLNLPSGASVEVKQALIARECTNNPRGRMMLERIQNAVRQAINPDIGQQEQQQPQGAVT